MFGEATGAPAGTVPFQDEEQRPPLSPHHARAQPGGTTLPGRKRVFTGDGICQHPDLGLGTPRDRENLMSAP